MKCIYCNISCMYTHFVSFLQSVLTMWKSEQSNRELINTRLRVWRPTQYTKLQLGPKTLRPRHLLTKKAWYACWKNYRRTLNFERSIKVSYILLVDFTQKFLSFISKNFVLSKNSKYFKMWTIAQKRCLIFLMFSFGQRTTTNSWIANFGSEIKILARVCLEKKFRQASF